MFLLEEFDWGQLHLQLRLNQWLWKLGGHEVGRATDYHMTCKFMLNEYQGLDKLDKFISVHIMKGKSWKKGGESAEEKNYIQPN